MSRHRLTVVLSQAQGKHPAKRALEEAIAAALIMEPGLDVSVVPAPVRPRPRPHRPAVPRSRSRATWSCWLAVPAGRVLAARPRRHQGPLRRDAAQAAGRRRRRGSRRSRSRRRASAPVDVPDRHIYCLDLRDFNESRAVRRGGAPHRRRVPGAARGEAGGNGPGNPALVQLGVPEVPAGAAAFAPEQLLAAAGPALVSGDRLQPLHELHGVPRLLPVRRLRRRRAGPHPGREPGQLQEGLPGVQPGLPRAGDHVPRVQDAGHRRRAGRRRQRAEDRPDASCSAASDAMRHRPPQERDRELVADGREAVGMAVGIPKRQADKPQEPKDDLDKLMDALDGWICGDMLALTASLPPTTPPAALLAERTPTATGSANCPPRPSPPPPPSMALHLVGARAARARRPHRRRPALAGGPPERRRRLGRHGQELQQHLDDDALPGRVPHHRHAARARRRATPRRGLADSRLRHDARRSWPRRSGGATARTAPSPCRS